jgi:hypothetical protein
MEDKHLVVGGQAKVALDAGAKLECRVERGQRIFRNLRTEMEAPMREPDRARIEWVRL